MIITALDLDNFRNYEKLHITPDPGINIIYGENAQGKTNLLEAVCLMSQGRSHRGARDKEMIRFGSEEAHLKMQVETGGSEIRVDMHLKSWKNKGIAVNLVPIRKTADFLGMVHSVLFSPEDLQIVKEGPSERRRFIDNELCLLDKIYLNEYIQYRKALEQRNRLLKDIVYEPSLMKTLDVWDEQLIRFGRDMIIRREDFIKELHDITLPIHYKLSGEREELELFYEPDIEAENFEKKLYESRERDLKTRTTNVGPHRDDMSFMVKDEHKIDARIYGSQGQQRTCALSLKLAEISLVEKVTGEKPVLLLDDVLSELDSGRQKYLLEGLNDIQTFITCTGLDEFIDKHLEDAKTYFVSQGMIQENAS